MDTDLGGLLVFLTAMVGSPGPANMVLLTAAAQYRIMRAATFFAGVVLGMQFIVWPVGFGLMELAARSPWVYEALRWLSAAYIVWLAWTIAGGRIDPDAVAGQPPRFAKGLVVHPLNPKAWVIAAGAFTQFVPASAPEAAATLTVAAALLVVQILCQGLWFWAGGALARLIGGTRLERAVMIALGVLTVASVFWALFAG